MDEVKDKFKSLFKGNSTKKSAFAGKGHRLGTDEAKPAATHPRLAASAAASQRPASNNQPAAPTIAPPQQQPKPAAAGQELKPATEFSPFTAVIGGGAARTTNSMNPSNAASSSSSGGRQPDTQASSSSSWQGAPVTQQRQQTPPQVPSNAAERANVPTAVVEDMQHCLALVASQPQAAVASLEVLHKLLANLLAAPQEAKFRQLRLGPNPNPKIQAAVLEVSGALDFLKACGFEVHGDLTTASSGSSSSSQAESFAYFIDDAKLSYVESGLSQLQLALQSAQGGGAEQQHVQQQPSPPVVRQQAATQSANSNAAATSSSTQTAIAQPAPPAAAVAPAARNTLVLLPAAPDIDVPEWFFERTAAEVKAEFMSLLRQRQSKQVFASKAWKDLQQAGGSSSSGGSKQPSVITLRVRFPEGVCLQGYFGVREPVTAVFEWVTQSLRDPGCIYELITPSRKALTTTGTVRQADLGGAVLNFRALQGTNQQQQQHGYSVDAKGSWQPFLSDAVLAQAQAD